MITGDSFLRAEMLRDPCRIAHCRETGGESGGVWGMQ